MARITYSEQFIEDAQGIRLAKKRAQVRRSIEQLSDFPEIGSPTLSDYIVKEYGPQVRKLVVSPFVAIYEYDGDADTVNVLALVHQRAAW